LSTYRVPDALVDPVTHRDLVVGPDVLEAGDFDRVDDVVAVSDHLGAVSRSADRPPLARQLDQSLGDPARQLEACRVDVDEREGSFIQAFDSEDVGDQLASKDCTSRSDESDLRHPSFGLTIPRPTRALTARN
jgi:hypothetical protein